MNVVPLTATSSAAAAAHVAEFTRPAPARPLSKEALRTAAPEVQRREVAQQFEAILVRQLLGKTMNSMLGSDDGVAGSVYGDIMTETLAQQLTRGQGLGLSRMLEQQLTPRGATASDSSSATAS